MKKQKFIKTDISSILKQYEGGREPMEFCREYGIAKVTLYNWRKKYSDTESTHIKELKALQDEKRRPKQMYAELKLDHQLAKNI